MTKDSVESVARSHTSRRHTTHYSVLHPTDALAALKQARVWYGGTAAVRTLWSDPDLALELLVLRAGTEVAPPPHSGTVLLQCLTGLACVCLPGQVKTLAPLDLVPMSPNTAYQLEAQRESAVLRFTIHSAGTPVGGRDDSSPNHAQRGRR
jgi:quercetin dioxygenase-like cupin family protein